MLSDYYYCPENWSTQLRSSESTLLHCTSPKLSEVPNMTAFPCNGTAWIGSRGVSGVKSAGNRSFMNGMKSKSSKYQVRNPLKACQKCNQSRMWSMCFWKFCSWFPWLFHHKTTWGATKPLLMSVSLWWGTRRSNPRSGERSPSCTEWRRCVAGQRRFSCKPLQRLFPFLMGLVPNNLHKGLSIFQTSLYS